MQHDTIERSALGPPMSLGTLYNAYNESSCYLSFLNENPPPANYISLVQKPNTKFEFVHVKSASDKFRLLNVTAELQISQLAGLVECFGSGKYFQTEKSSARSVSVSLVQRITTKQENLRILDPSFRAMINLDALKHRSATHVVTGITWGANLIVTAESQNEEKKDAQMVAGNLQATLERISKGASITKSAEDTTANSKFELKIIGDVLVPGQIPQTIEDIMALVGQMSELTKEYNSGKGVPVRYELTSLESIQSYLKVGVNAHILFCPLQDDAILGVTQVFDEITEAKLMLNDFSSDVKKFQAHLPERMLDHARKLQQGAKVAEAQLGCRLKNLLVAVRSGKADVAKLGDLRGMYESGPYSARDVLHTLNQDLYGVQRKLEQLKSLTALGVAIIPKHTRRLVNKLLEFKGKTVYVLFGESEAIAMDNGKLWGEHLIALRKLAEHKHIPKSSAFLFVDLDLSPHLKPHRVGNRERKICLQKFGPNLECWEDDVEKTVGWELRQHDEWRNNYIG